jgi:hypothetical protein
MVLCQRKDNEWRQVVRTICQRTTYRTKQSEHVASPGRETHHVEGIPGLDAMVLMDNGFGRFAAKNTCLCPSFRDLMFRLRVPRSIFDLGRDAAFTVTCLAMPRMSW